MLVLIDLKAKKYALFYYFFLPAICGLAQMAGNEKCCLVFSLFDSFRFNIRSPLVANIYLLLSHVSMLARVGVCVLVIVFIALLLCLFVHTIKHIHTSS